MSIGNSSTQLASRRGLFADLQRGARLLDRQRYASARIARARQPNPLLQRHRLAVHLHMGPLVVLEKSDNELGAVATAIGLEGRGLSRGRRPGQRGSGCEQRTENGELTAIHISPWKQQV